MISSFHFRSVTVAGEFGLPCMNGWIDERVYCLCMVVLLGVRLVVLLGFRFGSCMTVAVAFAP